MIEKPGGSKHISSKLKARSSKLMGSKLKAEGSKVKGWEAERVKGLEDGIVRSRKKIAKTNPDTSN